MRTFVYGSRVIENEQQIKFERRVKKIGNWIHAIVEFFVALVLFALINMLLSNLAQHTNMFSLHTCRLLQEAARVFLVDNALSTAAFAHQLVVSFVSSLVVACIAHQYGLVVRTLGSTDESEEEEDKHTKCEREPQTVNGFSIVCYKHKVCFLS